MRGIAIIKYDTLLNLKAIFYTMHFVEKAYHESNKLEYVQEHIHKSLYLPEDALIERNIC